jgi:DNA repair exonuclease SbcCD ATPase subunit
LSANWHVRPEDRARLRAELAALDARLNELDQRRREAFDRQRYGRSAENCSTAAEDLEKLVAEMDRVMTRSRAVEGKLLLLQKLAQPSDDGGGPPRDRSRRVLVEVYRGPAGTKMNG